MPTSRPRLVRANTDSQLSDPGDSDSDSSSAGVSHLRSQSSAYASGSPVAHRSRSLHRKVSGLGEILVRATESTTEYLATSPQASTYNLRNARPSLQEVNSMTATPRHSHSRSHVSLSGYGTMDQDPPDTRAFYDDFTTIDWVHHTVVESSRRKYLLSLPGLRGRVARLYDGIQGWLLITIVAFVFTLIAYAIDACESVLSDLRHGYCSTRWFSRASLCCPNVEKLGDCPAWISWSQLEGLPLQRAIAFDFVAYLAFTVIFAYISVTLTLTTKNGVPAAAVGPSSPRFEKTNSPPSASSNPESSRPRNVETQTDPLIRRETPVQPTAESKHVIYCGTGSGVAEVKTILSGFIIRRFLGTHTLITKSVALVFSISSGLSVGKEGPFVHLATCVGNISCRLFRKYSENDVKRRQVLSAAASAGVALAFGSPLGGVLFSLEEVSYYFLPHHLFRIFFCAMMSALFLKFMDPYKTGKIVLFEVVYSKDWQFWELPNFIFIGVCGGLFGAALCRFVLFWSSTFRTWKIIRRSPTFEVVAIALITGVVTFFNPHTSKSVTELLLDLASPCDETAPSLALCPKDPSHIPGILASLGYALLIKVVLTAVTFGVKVPAGIYVPSMVIGALFGRMVGLSIQYVDNIQPELLRTYGMGSAIVSGTYAMAGAGAFLAGVTRMNVTLATILFEVTGSLDHVIPFSIAILVANWVANAIEPESLYELLLERNNFPYLDNRRVRSFDSSLVDVVSRVPRNELIDLSMSDLVSSDRLRSLTGLLQSRGEFDGCIPIVKGRILQGIISVPELEFSLDKLQASCIRAGVEPHVVNCRISVKDTDVSRYHHYYSSTQDTQGLETNDDYFSSFMGYRVSPASMTAMRPAEDDDDILSGDAMTEDILRDSDLTRYIDRAPITMDIHSPLALVDMMFVKLGVRQLCVLHDGKFAGILHRKKYIDFCHLHRD